jgi:hypothetical protein
MQYFPMKLAEDWGKDGNMMLKLIFGKISPENIN